MVLPYSATTVAGLFRGAVLAIKLQTSKLSGLGVAADDGKRESTIIL